MGIDPPTGWCILEMRPGTQRPQFVACARAEEWSTIPWCSSDLGLLVVEDATFFFPSDARTQTAGNALAARAQALWEVQKLGQRIFGMAMRCGIAAAEVTSMEWRRVLGVRVGGRSAGGSVDARVEQALLLRVENWPRRSNDTVRDAAGVAIGGYEKWRSGRAAA